jgi:hypothetical protein
MIFDASLFFSRQSDPPATSSSRIDADSAGSWRRRRSSLPRDLIRGKGQASSARTERENPISSSKGGGCADTAGADDEHTDRRVMTHEDRLRPSRDFRDATNLVTRARLGALGDGRSSPEVSTDRERRNDQDGRKKGDERGRQMMDRARTNESIGEFRLRPVRPDEPARCMAVGSNVETGLLATHYNSSSSAPSKSFSAERIRDREAAHAQLNALAWPKRNGLRWVADPIAVFSLEAIHG